MERGGAQVEEVPELLFPRAQQEACARLLIAALPEEACALLVGLRTKAGHEVMRLAEISNLAADPDSFRLDPIAWREVERVAREEGLEVLGVWHSHPRATAAPSPRDRTGAQPGWSHAISAADEPTRLRSYFLCGGRLKEQRVLTETPVP